MSNYPYNMSINKGIKKITVVFTKQIKQSKETKGRFSVLYFKDLINRKSS